MTPHFFAPPTWSTSSFGHNTDNSARELSSLAEHLNLCQGQRGRLFSLHCLAEATHGLLAARFVTTLVGIALLFAVASLAA